DTTRWLEDLEEDLSVLNKLWSSVVDIRGEKDTKLQHLLKLLNDKVQNPFNSNNKKAIVFTAFADTANYLYENISKVLKDNYNINTALVTGSNRKSTAKKIPTDLNAILSCFSPISKDKEQL